MRLLFSECKSDYAHYVFPYAVWAIPEPGERPSQIFEQGFLPSTHNLDRYYLCRQIRIRLAAFAPSSENRRIFRKFEGIDCTLVPRAEFDFTPRKRDFFKQYADIKFGKNIMTYKRLDSLLNSQIISHILVFHDSVTGADVGYVTMFLEPNELAYYYYSFYDLNYYRRNLGMYMMTSAVDYFAGLKYHYLYLGTCYSRNALYKTQFSGFEFSNGFRWSNDLKELKYILKRDQDVMTQHLVESGEFVDRFYNGNLDELTANFGVWVKL